MGAKAGTREGGYVDPEPVFSVLFGGEKFVPIIGSISLAKEMKAAMQEGEEDDYEEEAATVAGKVAIFTEIAAGQNDRDMINGYKQMCELEA